MILRKLNQVLKIKLSEAGKVDSQKLLRIIGIWVFRLKWNGSMFRIDERKNHGPSLPTLVLRLPMHSPCQCLSPSASVLSLAMPWWDWLLAGLERPLEKRRRCRATRLWVVEPNAIAALQPLSTPAQAAQPNLVCFPTHFQSYLLQLLSSIERTWVAFFYIVTTLCCPFNRVCLNMKTNSTDP